MKDLEKECRPRDASPIHLGNNSSPNEVVPDPSVPPSLAIPVEGVMAEKSFVAETPPDGGIQAWLQVLGSFFLFFNSW